MVVFALKVNGCVGFNPYLLLNSQTAVNMTGLSKHVCIYKLKEHGMREEMYRYIF
jgi:hypothetical protein